MFPIGKALVLPASMSICIWLLKRMQSNPMAEFLLYISQVMFLQRIRNLSFTVDPGYEQRAGEVQDAKVPPEAGSDGLCLNHQETGPNNFGEGATWILWYVYILYIYIFMLFYIVLSIYIYICKHAFTYPENWPSKGHLRKNTQQKKRGHNGEDKSGSQKMFPVSNLPLLLQLKGTPYGPRSNCDVPKNGHAVVRRDVARRIGQLGGEQMRFMERSQVCQDERWMDDDDVDDDGGLVKRNLLFQGKPCWWNIIIWLDGWWLIQMTLWSFCWFHLGDGFIIKLQEINEEFRKWWGWDPEKEDIID